MSAMPISIRLRPVLGEDIGETADDHDGLWMWMCGDVKIWTVKADMLGFGVFGLEI